LRESLELTEEKKDTRVNYGPIGPTHDYEKALQQSKQKEAKIDLEA